MPNSIVTSPQIQKFIDIAASTDEKAPLPDRKDWPADLKEIAFKIADLSGQWNPVEVFTPENYHSERDRFLEYFELGKIYNPKFEYKTNVKDILFVDDRTLRILLNQNRINEPNDYRYFDFNHLDQIDIIPEIKKYLKYLLSEVRRFEPDNMAGRLARVALYFKINDDMASVELVEGIKEKDETKIAAALKQKYSGTDESILTLADKAYERLGKSECLKNNPGILNPEQKKYLRETKAGPKEIKEAFLWVLKKYQMLKCDDCPDGFNVMIDSCFTSIDVRDKSKYGPTIGIPYDKVVSYEELLKLIGHELEGHARQSINGQRLFLLAGGPLKHDNEMLYEGLGKRYDDKIATEIFGENSGMPGPYFTYAVKAAEDGKSFYEIFVQQLNLRINILKQKKKYNHVKYAEAKNSAWKTTYRVMRGHINTYNTAKFAMAKDLAYLRGWQMDCELLLIEAGYINECGIVDFKSMSLLAKMDFDESNLPIKYINAAKDYLFEKLMPKMTASLN